MEFANYKPVSREISAKYLEKFFIKHNINPELNKSKLFFKAIQDTCETLTLPTQEILSQFDLFIVGKGGFGLSSYDSLSYYIKGIPDTRTGVAYFAKTILENENVPVCNFDVFDLKERVELLEKQVTKLMNFNATIK